MGGTAVTENGAAAGGANTHAADKKMFFTTSDLLDRMNAAIADATAESSADAEPPGGFELQKKMPDGSYRRAEESDRAAADFQAKMKQASAMIGSYAPQRKIAWAKSQRREGNALFALGNYKEAMDVYLTCLVAMDQSSTSDEQISGKNNDDAGDSNELLSIRIEKEIKLPVLLNLALSAIKLGMLSKAEEFCNFALETGAGAGSAKAHFRRGSVRMLRGQYATAAVDLEQALVLNGDVKETEKERTAILRERQKLKRLIQQAEKNRRQQKAAMQQLFKSGKKKDPTQQEAQTDLAPSLYPEMKGPILQNEGYQPNSWFEWYLIGAVGVLVIVIAMVVAKKTEG